MSPCFAIEIGSKTAKVLRKLTSSTDAVFKDEANDTFMYTRIPRTGCFNIARGGPDHHDCGRSLISGASASGGRCVPFTNPEGVKWEIHGTRTLRAHSLGASNLRSVVAKTQICVSYSQGTTYLPPRNHCQSVHRAVQPQRVRDAHVLRHAVQLIVPLLLDELSPTRGVASCTLSAFQCSRSSSLNGMLFALASAIDSPPHPS